MRGFTSVKVLGNKFFFFKFCKHPFQFLTVISGSTLHCDHI